MSFVYNIPNEFKLKYDDVNETMIVSDAFGEFLPFPWKMWYHLVDYPYRQHFRFQGRSVEYVIEILLRNYKHRYICNN